MRLYDAPVAPNPRRVRWLLVEKGVTDLEIVEIDIPGGQHKTPYFPGKGRADRLTIADIVAFVGIDFARIVRLKPPEDLTHLARWLAAMRERPAARA